MPNYDDNPGLKLPEPTPPTETQPAGKLCRQDIKDADEFTWSCSLLQGHSGYHIAYESHDLTGNVLAVSESASVAAPTERVADVIARMIQEVAPAPLCVSETAVSQLRPLLEELAQRRGMERVETSPLLCPFCGKQPERGEQQSSDETGERYGYFYIECHHSSNFSVVVHGDSEEECLAKWNQRLAVAPSPAGESQEEL